MGREGGKGLNILHIPLTANDIVKKNNVCAMMPVCFCVGAGVIYRNSNLPLFCQLK